MKNEFVPYDIALAMKELGFDNVPCLAIYYNVTDTDDIDYDAERHFTYSHYETQYYANKGYKDAVLAPLYQQAFRWFREEHNIKAYIQSISKSSIDYEYRIIGVEHRLEWGTYEQVELECLRKLIEIVKNK